MDIAAAEGTASRSVSLSSLRPEIMKGVMAAATVLVRTPQLLRRSSGRPQSFIARAKEAADASVLLGPFRSAGRFDSCLEDAGMLIESVGNHEQPVVTCSLTVNEGLANAFGTMHGGAVSTLVDVVGTLALLCKDPERPGVTVEMNQSFFAAAKLGRRLTISGEVLGYGRTMGFTQVTISDESQKVLALGRHTKVFPKS